MSSTTAIGLDYGTHSTVISALPENGSQIVMQSPQGELLHPTVTYYPHDSTESIEFGAVALARLPDDNVIIQAKRAFGVTTSSLTKKSLLDSFNAKVAVPKSNQAKVKFLLTIDGQQVEKKVEDVVRDQLYYFKGIVNRDYGEKVSFVFSRPQYWSPTQTEMFGTLLEEVFGTDKIVAVVTEPNAAQFCYKVCGAVENKHMVCVFDIGCGTFDISFLRETSPGTYAGIATGGNSFLGGADMDNQLLSALEEELSVVDGFKKEVFEEQKPLLLGHMKDLKHKLSISNVGKYVVFGCTPTSYTFAVDQQKKKQILHEFYTNIEDCIHNTFTSKAKGLKKTADSVKQKAQEMKNEVDVVILVGGVMRDPLLSTDVFSKIFPKADIIGKPGAKGSLNPDEVVARGSSYWCAAKMKLKTKIGLPADPKHKNLLSKSIGVEGINPANEKKPLFCVVIPGNTPLPACKDKPGFTLSENNQAHILVSVYQGEGDYINDSEVEYLGEFKVPLKTPNKVDGPMITIEMEVNKDNILIVRVGEEGNEEEVFSVGNEGKEMVFSEVH